MLYMQNNFLTGATAICTQVSLFGAMCHAALKKNSHIKCWMPELIYSFTHFTSADITTLSVEFSVEVFFPYSSV